MIMQAGYLLAFSTGLLGGFGHCIGMCGPLVASYSLSSGKGHFRAVPHFLYSAGRITTYSFMGALMGMGGSFINTAGRLSGIQNVAAALTGIAMITMGLGISGIFRFSGLWKKTGLSMGAARLILDDGETGSILRYYPLGLLFGLVPCGLSYSVFLGAAATAGLLPGMLYSLSFGIGTLPALFLFGLAIGYLGGRARGWLYRGSGVLVIISGVYFIARALVFHAHM